MIVDHLDRALATKNYGHHAGYVLLGLVLPLKGRKARRRLGQARNEEAVVVSIKKRVS